MAVSFAELSDVSVLLDHPIVGAQEKAVETNLENISIRLSAWYPGLRSTWQNAEEGSELKDFLRVVVAELAAKIARNPKGIASETVGPFAYSKFDSEDISKEMFNAADLRAIEAFLRAEKDRPVFSFRQRPPTLPAYPQMGRGSSAYQYTRHGRF